MKYDFELRTLKFSQHTLSLLSGIKKDNLNEHIIDQLARSSTSIGANYREANSASTKRDFRNKIAIARKEANEAEYWIQLLLSFNGNNELRVLLKEAHEIALILGSIYAKVTTK